jgi:3-oxoacyl-[acyl-carrier protein] reductase
MNLKEKNVLVIGASSSIGQSVVEGFLSRGAKLLATVHEKKPRELYQQGVTVATLDLTNLASIEQFCSMCLSDFGKLDVVIFLSGILPGRGLDNYDDELIQEVMSINFTGQAALLRRLLPNMSPRSLVLMLSSISGERGSFDPIYAAAKSAQIGFVKSMATWLAPNIRFNAIAPALIENSTMYNNMTPERREHHLKQTPTGRLSTAEDVSGVILSLCDPAWSNVNGQVIRINGGLHV